MTILAPAELNNGVSIKPPTAYGVATNVWKDDGSGNGAFAAVAYSEVTGTPTLGSAAYVNLSAFLQPSNNLSDLANAATARTNLGLATVASTGSYNDLSSKPDLTVYATLASPAFTGNPTAPNQTAGDSSTKIANTAFVATAINTVLAAAPNKASVKYATTAALAANTYANGSSGVGATLTANANGALTVDGSSPALNDPILVRNEATTANNGIYTLTQLGDGSHPYILTRRTDFDQSTEVFAGDATFVTSGSTLASTTWCMITAGTITIGSTAITWTQTAGPGSYIAGTGLAITGSTFSVLASQTQITAIGTIATGIWNATVINPVYGGTGIANASGSTLTLNAANSVSLWTISSAIGATSTDGIVRTTGVVATQGSPQWSLRDRYHAEAFKTNATATRQTYDYIVEAQAADGAAASTSNYVISSSFQGGAYGAILTLGNTGALTVANSVISGGDFRATGAGVIFWNARTQLWSPVNGTLQVSNNAATGMTKVLWGVDTNAAPTAFTMQIGSVVAGTSNTAGANFSYSASQGTGTGNSGSHVFRVGPASTTGTTVNGLVDSVTIAATGTTIAQPTNISGTPTALTVTGAAHTGLTTTAEDIGINLNMSATKTWVAGTVATQREVLIQAPTYTCGSAMTITKAGTFVVSGAPIAAGSVTITNPYAFWIQAGASQFDGNVTITGQATLTPQTLTSTSASIAWNAANGNNAQHTATENTTLANPTNLVNGTVYTFAWTQHASAAKTLAFGSKWAFGSGSSTVSVTVGSVQIFTGIYNSTADKIYTVMTGPF